MYTFRLTIILTIVAVGLTACTGSFAQNKFYDQSKQHHTESGFQNPPNSPVRTSSPFRFISFVVKRLTEDNDEIVLPEGHILEKSQVQQQLAAAPKEGRITWVGHAGFLIGLNGINILTDPHFSERASPFSFAGPKRYMPPPLTVKELPKIDVILISHNHYDSLDETSIRQLAEHSPEVKILVPLGDGELVRDWGMKNVQEVDWYDTIKVGAVTFQSTPAIHRANRGLFDVNNSLWGGFTIDGTVDGKAKKIWFVGDTGFGPAFRNDIAKKVGAVDIALIPNGAFMPRDVMKAVHVNPEEAIQLAKILGAKTVIPMHWGTFPLGEDVPEDGIKAFRAAPGLGLKKVLMRIGETLSLSGL